MGFPHAETIIKVTRLSSKNKKGSKPECAYYVSSISRDKYTDEQWMQLIRGHWGGIEIRNHWRKDACLLEDATRSRNPNIVACLAMLRNCYLHFHALPHNYGSLPALTEAVAANPKLALHMLMGRF